MKKTSIPRDIAGELVAMLRRQAAARDALARCLQAHLSREAVVLVGLMLARISNEIDAEVVQPILNQHPDLAGEQAP